MKQSTQLFWPYLFLKWTSNLNETQKLTNIFCDLKVKWTFWKLNYKTIINSLLNYNYANTCTTEWSTCITYCPNLTENEAASFVLILASLSTQYQYLESPFLVFRRNKKSLWTRVCPPLLFSINLMLTSAFAMMMVYD